MVRRGIHLQAGGDGEAPVPRPEWLPEGCEMLADGEYDAIVMGTGLKEAIMSGLLSTLGMKVFEHPRNASIMAHNRTFRCLCRAARCHMVEFFPSLLSVRAYGKGRRGK